ncbi:MAG: hypothetical protein Q8Q39_01855 [bacterium]|nr:hypothetical protein [bacterium]
MIYSPENPNFEENSEKEPEESTEIKRTKVADLTPEQIAEYEAYMEENPEPPAPEQKRDCGPEILEFEGVIAAAESEHSLEYLHTIAAPEEALRDPQRLALKEKLVPIVERLVSLQNETNISADKLAELKDKYIKLSRAVGMINSGKVDHTR